MFKIVRTGRGRGKARLEADAVLMPAEFQRIAEEAGRRRCLRARKTGFIAARRAAKRQVVETHWNGRETTNTARAGDWIVTNLTPERKPLRDRDGRLNTYVIAAEGFDSLYEPAGGEGEFGAIYRARHPVEAIKFPGGFDIVASWGERQTATSGYLIFNGKDVYGNHAETFAATYDVVPASRSRKS
jgi:hypothetical protein